MYKVINSSNDLALQALEKLLIRPLLNILVSAKRENKPLQSCQAFSKLGKKSANVVKIALSQSVGKKKVTLEDKCTAIVKRCSLRQILHAQQTYTEQTDRLTRGDYAVSVTALPSQFKHLFSTCLYEKLFDNKAIWNATGEKQLTRKVFHENFRSDNQYPSTCPYCDLDTINSSGTQVVEHFLPKAKFPLLSMFSKNLFSACNGCNMSAGKGSKVAVSVTTPYVDEIGELVTFTFNSSLKNIGITSTSGRTDVDGFLNLISLPTRYAEKNTWHQFDGRERAFCEAVQGRSIASLTKLMEYLDSSQRGAVLTYAMKHRIRQLYSAGYSF